jgi:hypothetical protein
VPEWPGGEDAKMDKSKQQRERGRRGAAAMANATRGRSRVVGPDRTKYDRKAGKAVERE